MTLPRAIVVMGVSGAGKTTLAAALAAQLGYQFIEGDALHAPSNVAKMAAGQPLNDADRGPWLADVGRALAQAVASGGGVAACSALKRSYRDVLRAAISEPLLFVHPVLDEHELRARLAARTGHFMPATLIASQLCTLEPAGDDEPIISIDGCLSTEEQIAACSTARLRL